MPQSHKDLIIWKKTMELVTETYQEILKFPKEEVYGLTSQIRRSAVSTPSNIAEGKGRRSSKEFRQFLTQARGSLGELETQIQIAENLGYLEIVGCERLKSKASELGKMLNGFLEAVAVRKQ